MSVRPSARSLAAGALLCLSSTPDVHALRCEDGERGYYDVGKGAVVFHEVFSQSRGVVVAGADAASFQAYRQHCGSGLYARDKDNVYYKGAKVPGAHLESFKPLKGQYASDKDWWYGGAKPIATKKGGVLLVGNGWGAYARHAEGVFYGAKRLEAEGFEAFGAGGYARSRNHAYYRGELLEGIDAATFQVLPHSDGMAKDKANVVVNGRVQKRLDAASLEELGGAGGLTRDKRNVYMNSQAVEGADAASAAPIGAGYWRDRAAVYFGGRKIEGSDPASFQVLESRMGADKHRVYRDGRPLQGADPASFRMLANGYARDSASIYYLDRRIEGADMQTFSPTRNAGTARDRSHGYQYGKPVCAWPDAVSSSLPACDPRRYIAR